MLLDQHPYLPIRSADLALHDTGAIAPAEYGGLAVWAHYPVFQRWASPVPQLDGASVLVLHLDRRLVFVFNTSKYLLFVTRHDVYPAFVLHPRVPPKL